MGGVCARAQGDAKLVNGYRPTWWKEAVVYQIYPRSFKDSNGDGIGDLKGITSKLDYIKGLGVTVVWLSPHYDSPNADNGYDIRDYRKVMTEFGTMADFDTMLAEIKKRHMRLIIDLVVNHTSDEHRWFVESRKSKDNPYRDFYIWRSPKDGHEPNNDPSFFSGSAWQFDETTNQYYLHYFAVKQPDLNWDNPKVRSEVYSLMKFWLDKGVDGFRMDVIPLISKNQDFPDLTPEQLRNFGNAYANGPHMHDYLQEMNREVMAKYDVMTVGEALGISLEQTPLMVGEDRKELNMIFNFDAVRLDRQGSQWKDWSLPDLKAIYTKHAEGLDTHSWDTVFLSNHDNPRVVSSFGNDSDAYRVPSAKLLTTMLLTLRGTPFFYQGDELGMTNYPFREDRGLRRYRGEERLQSAGTDGADLRDGLYCESAADFARQCADSDAVGRDGECGIYHGAEAVAGGESELHEDQCGGGVEGPGFAVQLHGEDGEAAEGDSGVCVWGLQGPRSGECVDLRVHKDAGGGEVPGGAELFG